MLIHGASRALPLLCLITIAACGSPARALAPDVTAAVRTAVDAKAPSFALADDGERGHQLWREEQRFYKQNGYRLVWSDGKRPRCKPTG